MLYYLKLYMQFYIQTYLCIKLFKISKEHDYIQSQYIFITTIEFLFSLPRKLQLNKLFVNCVPTFFCVFILRFDIRYIKSSSMRIVLSSAQQVN